MDDFKQDGESWQDYAHRLEARIKQQREQLKALEDLRDGPQRSHRKHIARLERLLGQKEAKLANQYEALKVLHEQARKIG